MEPPISILPSDCLREIFLYIPLKERGAIRLVCKKWRNAVDDCWRLFRALHIKYACKPPDANDETPQRTHVDTHKHSITLRTQNSAVVDSLLKHCAPYLKVFVEKGDRYIPHLPKNLRYCRNLISTAIGVQSAGDEQVLYEVLRANAKIKYLILTFHPEIFYRCPRFQAPNLKELEIVRICGLFESNKSEYPYLRLHRCDNVAEVNHYFKATTAIKQDHPKKQADGSILNLTNLKTLRIHTSPSLDYINNTIIYLTANCWQLEEVKILGYPSITNESILALSRLSSLTKLTIIDSLWITDELLCLFNKVEYLCVNCCSNVCNPGVIKLLRQSHQLKFLSLQHTKITADVVSAANEAVWSRKNKIPLTLQINRRIVETYSMRNISPLLKITS